MAISQLIDLEFDENWVHVSRVETEVINISWISFFQFKWPSSEADVIYKISWCAHRSLSAIKRIRHLLPFNILINVYDSLVQPYFNCCSVVWGNCGSGLSEKLQKLQDRATRIWCVPVMTLISMNCSRHWVGVNSNIKDLNQLLLWCTNLYMGWPLSIWVLDLCFETTKHHIVQGILKINWLFRSPAPIIWRRVSLTAETGYGTTYLVTFVQQHLYMILNLTYVTTVLNEF